MASRKPLVNVAGALSEVPSGDSLTVAGIIESTSGGIKFPDASIQTTAYTGGGEEVGAHLGALQENYSTMMVLVVLLGLLMLKYPMIT